MAAYYKCTSARHLQAVCDKATCATGLFSPTTRVKAKVENISIDEAIERVTA